MVSVRGLKGGERTGASAFATSAAAFGRTTRVEYLDESKPGACLVRTIAYFS
jgi:hypothetical protein